MRLACIQGDSIIRENSAVQPNAGPSDHNITFNAITRYIWMNFIICTVISTGNPLPFGPLAFAASVPYPDSAMVEIEQIRVLDNC